MNIRVKSYEVHLVRLRLLFILFVVVITAAVLMGTFNFGAGTQVQFGTRWRS